MLIKVTDKKSGLEVGKKYELTDMSARTLIRGGQAVLVTKTDDVKDGKVAADDVESQKGKKGKK